MIGRPPVIAVVIIAVIFTLLPIDLKTHAQCPSGAGSNYYWIGNSSSSLWPQQECESNNGTLVTITDIDLIHFIIENFTLGNGECYLTGFNDADMNNTFEWKSGYPLSCSLYENFTTAEDSACYCTDFMDNMTALAPNVSSCNESINFICEKWCSLPPTITNVNTNSTARYHGATFTWTCTTGYSPSPAGGMVTCLQDTWSATPSCAINTCATNEIPSSVDGGSVVGLPGGATANYNTTIEYTCYEDEGFYLAGYVAQWTRICQADGTWSSTNITCIVGNCSVPATGVDVMTITDSVIDVNETVNFICNNGSEPVTANVTCLPNRTLSADIACQIVTCQTEGLTLEFGTINVTGTPLPYATVITYTCNATEGRYLSPENQVSRTCQADKMWSDPAPTCELGVCDSLDNPDQGTYNHPNTTALSSITLTCEPGYKVNGTVGDMVDVDCLANKMWASTPECVRIECDALPDIMNGTIIYTPPTVGASDSVFESVAMFTCDAGLFQIEPSDWKPLMCNASGAWNGTVPACNPICNVMDCVKDLPQKYQYVYDDAFLRSNETFCSDVNGALVCLDWVGCNSSYRVPLQKYKDECELPCPEFIDSIRVCSSPTDCQNVIDHCLPADRVWTCDAFTMARMCLQTQFTDVADPPKTILLQVIDHLLQCPSSGTTASLPVNIILLLVVVWTSHIGLIRRTEQVVRHD